VAAGSGIPPGCFSIAVGPERLHSSLAAAMNAYTLAGRTRGWRVRGFTILAAAIVFALFTMFLSPRPRSTNTPPVRVAPALADELLPPVHPIFGTAKKTIGLDIHPTQTMGRPTGLKAALYEVFGQHGPSVPPPSPIQSDLLVGDTELFWSSGGYRHGYLYFGARYGSGRVPVWEFAPCSKANLSEITSQDLPARFVAHNDKTNGPASFGTNWLWKGGGGAIRVNQGDMILARPAADPASVYALDFARLDLTNAVVFFIRISP
jgi:hypothetical protein